MVMRVAIRRPFLSSRFFLRYIALSLIRGYQIWISPLRRPACRYYPTCSAYMFEAIEKKGLLYGLFLGIQRLLRCHPFHPGGMDPLK